MKKVSKKLFAILIKNIVAWGNRINRNFTSRTMEEICAALTDEQYFFSMYIRPRQIERYSFVQELYHNRKLAIIMQGPICIQDSMTLDSVHFYKKMYPHSEVIISTWDDEDDNVIDELQKAGAIIVKSSPPTKSGILNVNYQIISSRAGLRKAQELGYEYAVKTRTDQRIYKNYIFDHMIMELERYKPVLGSEQERRITLLAMNYGNMFTPYYMSDFLYLGHIGDLLALFSAPLDTRASTRNQFVIEKGISRRMCSKIKYSPEIYLLKHYLTDILNYDCDDTVKAYWTAVKKYFICYSIKDVDLFWTKYGRCYELNKYYGDFFLEPEQEQGMATLCFDHMNWLGLYYDTMEYREEYEKYADYSMF